MSCYSIGILSPKPTRPVLEMLGGTSASVGEFVRQTEAHFKSENLSWKQKGDRVELQKHSVRNNQ